MNITSSISFFSQKRVNQNSDTVSPSVYTTLQMQVPRINPLTAEWALRALIDFTLSNARRFYSSMGNPLDGKGLLTKEGLPK